MAEFVKVVAEQGVRYTIPGAGYEVEVDGKRKWDVFEDAIAAARTTIQTFDYRATGGGLKDSRVFVELRQYSRNAPAKYGVGTDEPLLRWEVFQDLVVLVPEGTGGLTDEQAEDAKSIRSQKVVLV